MTSGTDLFELGLLLASLLLLLLSAYLAWRLWAVTQRAERWRGEHEEARTLLATLEERLSAREAASAEIQATLNERESRLTKAEDQTAALRTDLAAMNERLAHERRTADEKLALLNDNREQMNLQFKSLANDVLRHQSEDFKKAATTQVQGLIAPLQQNLGKFESELRNTQQDAMKERAALKEKLGTLTNESARLSKEADNLTKALRGDSRQQGAWGEAILEKLLESSGLEEGREYRSQTSTRTEDGRLMRPDVVVSLPGNRELVIDSKVSLTAYNEAVNAEDSSAKDAALARHVLSLSTHIKGLAAKDYAEVTQGALDYVIMFVPIEGALSEAIRAKPDLTAMAADARVMIATPTTLMMALRTIKNVWDVERRNTNAEEIAKRAGKLYDKFVGFIDDMQKVNDQLDKARNTHSAALSKLSDGPGNLVRQVEMLKDLRAKTSKALPNELLDKAQANGSESAPEGSKQIPLHRRRDEAS